MTYNPHMPKPGQQK